METRTIVLNLQPRTVIQVMKVSQYDVGVPMSFIIYDGANPASISSGTTVTLEMTRPSGISYSRSGSISGNVVSMSTTLDMTRESGDIEAELRFVRNSEDVGTCNFTLSVEPAAKKDDAIDADTEALQLIADQVRADTIQSTSNATLARTAETNARSYAASAKTNADIAVAAAQSAGKASTEAADAKEIAVDAATRAEAAADRLIPDTTLTLEGMPAEAKATGDRIAALRDDLNNNIGDALLELLRHVAYIDGDPETLFNNLYEAFQNTAPAKTYYRRWSTSPVDDAYGKIEWRTSIVLGEDLKDELVPNIKDSPTRSALYTLSNYSDVKVANNETASEIEAYLIELPPGSTGFTATFGNSGGTCLYVFKRDIDGRYKCIHDVDGTSIIKWYTDSETITGLSPTDRYVVGGSSKVMQAFSVTMEVI